jgi:hypothetical protein
VTDSAVTEASVQADAGFGGLQRCRAASQPCLCQSVREQPDAVTEPLSVGSRRHILDGAVILDIKQDRRRDDPSGAVAPPADPNAVGREASERALDLVPLIAVRRVADRTRIGRSDWLAGSAPRRRVLVHRRTV